MGAEIPIWVGGLLKWISGVTKRTTCDDVVQAVIASSECPKGGDRDHQQYAIVERWRKVERPLEGKSRILKVWKTWGDEQCNVRLMMKKIPPDSPRECRTPTHHHHHHSHHQRKRGHAKGSRNPRGQTWHPRKLRGTLPDDDSVDLEDECPEVAVDRLVDVLRTQGETLANQRLRLQEKDKEIEYYETKMHMMRMEEIGANYVQDAYLGLGQAADVVDPTSLDEAIQLYEKLLEVCRRIDREEASIADLSARIRRTVSLQCSADAESAADDVELEAERTRRKVEELVETAEEQRVTLAQNDAALRESERLLAERKRLLRHTEVDLDHADQEFSRLQRNLEEAIRCPTATMPLVVEAVPDQPSAGNVNSFPECRGKSESATDNSSDTGISSLHSSSSDEGAGYVLDTLV